MAKCDGGELLAQLTDIVGEAGILIGDDVTSRPNASWGKGQCPAIAVVRPASTEELSSIAKLCFENHQTMVPCGGLTGLVDGFTAAKNDLVISFDRMNAVESIDDAAGTMVVQSGAILEFVQQQAESAGWQFPVDYGARGSAQIGGMISTNAGGNGVIRYGMARQNILGLEAVLADGTVISAMNEMLKNNAGYDLKQFFIGTEGTLGMVTKAVLKLAPPTPARQTALLAVQDFSQVLSLLKYLGSALEGKLSAFEVLWQSHYQLLVADTARHQAMLPTNFPYYVLVEAAGSDDAALALQFAAAMEKALEDGLIADAVLAQSESQRDRLWQMRDDVHGALDALAPAAVFDVSLPVRDAGQYVAQLEQSLAAECPEGRLVAFGHLGDGNIHLMFGPYRDKEAVERLVYGPLQQLKGSVSAEHGIGLEKRDYLPLSRSAAEIALMKEIKTTFDTRSILNPGKVIG